METTLSKWSIVQQVNMENLLILTMDVMADLWNRRLPIQARDHRIKQSDVSDKFV